VKRPRSADHQNGKPLAGCGSSSKPAYCSPVSKVENAVKSLPTVDDVKKNGVGTLKSAVLQLQENATAAVNQAKSDFSSPDFGTEDLGGRAVEHRPPPRTFRPRFRRSADDRQLRTIHRSRRLTRWRL
jgi:hypothetical protein